MPSRKNRKPKNGANRDPLTNEPGAAVGTMGGPMSIAVGAALRWLLGGLSGMTAAEAVNPSVEDAYWRRNYRTRPYVKPGSSYETYRPAYEAGWEARGLYGELNWERVEPRLREDWTRNRADSSMSWDEASPAARDAFDRLRPSEDYRAENR